MKRASRPFIFSTASYLTRIENQTASSAAELREGLARCTDGSIFYHTFQSLGPHHFLTEGFSNDFAQWALASLKQPGLAEQLAGLDVRGYLDLSDLRHDVLRIMDDFRRAHPDEAVRPAFEPFHFCASVEVAAPLEWEAWSLEEFRHGLVRVGHASFHFHFLASRLRLRLRTNDCSVWFAEALDLERLARMTDRIDICTCTLDGAKARLLALIDRELAA
jgi:Family of unknown function (DUF5752)